MSVNKIVFEETGEGVPFAGVQFLGSGGGSTADVDGFVNIPADAWPVQLVALQIDSVIYNQDPGTGILSAPAAVYLIDEAVIEGTPETPQTNKNLALLLFGAGIGLVLLLANGKGKK